MRAIKTFPWSWARLNLSGVFWENQFDATLIGNHNGGLVKRCPQMNSSSSYKNNDQLKHVA